MSKFMSLDKQLENKAKKWFVSEQEEQNKGLAKKWFEENKKEVIEEYMGKHPNIKKQYQNKKKELLKFKILLAGTGIVATTITGVYIAHNISKENKTEIEQEAVIDENMNVFDEQESEEKSYENFFEQAKGMNNTKQREELITNQTKQVIVETYNQKNPDNPITLDSLETLILDEFILQKKDKLGNYTYERVPQNIVMEQTDSQKLVKIGNIYDFRIDGKTVAVFDGNGQPLLDRNVENPDMEFKKSVDMIKQSEKLKDIYKYPSNDTEKKQEEQKYADLANQLLQKDKQINIQKDRTEQRD